MAKKKVYVEMVLSVDEAVSTEMAVKEVRSRVNDACCHTFEQEAVRVRSVGRAKMIRPLPKRCKPKECW